jgi:hypothetical protein
VRERLAGFTAGRSALLPPSEPAHFALSFLALRDLMQAIGYSATTAWIFPVLIDTAVAVGTLMLVALGDKPARRTRTVTASTSAQVKPGASNAPEPVSAPPRPHSVRADQVASSAESAPVDSALRAASAPDQHADAGADYAALAQALVDAGATTKPAAVVASILAAHAEGTALNRIASDTGIHHKTVSKIIDAAENHRRHLVAV